MINRKTIAWGMPDDPVPRTTSCAYGRFLAHEPRVPLGIAAFPAPSLSRGRDVPAKARALGAAGRLRASGGCEAPSDGAIRVFWFFAAAKSAYEDAAVTLKQGAHKGRPLHQIDLRRGDPCGRPLSTPRISPFPGAWLFDN